MLQVPLLSVVLHVYNNQNAFDKHINFWKYLPVHITNRIEFICIDDCSDPPLNIKREHLNCRFFRVLDDIKWNQPGCKNLAAFMAKASWILFIDADMVIEPAGFQLILDKIHLLDEAVRYQFKLVTFDGTVTSHVNTFLASKRGYFKAGGMDEDFAGNYGWEDIHFNSLWRRRVGGETVVTDVCFYEDIRFVTKDLDRDSMHNKELAFNKIQINDCANSVGKVRFNWEEV